MTYDRKKYESDVRNFVFGVEDSLVSSVGLLSGIAAAEATRETIILTGVVLIFVEAFSMGVGSVLSDNSTQEFDEHKTVPLSRSMRGGFVMLISYFIAGFIPLLPYVLIPSNAAFGVSILASLIGLIALGYFSARMARVSPLGESVKMFVLGGAAVAIGVAIGSLLR